MNQPPSHCLSAPCNAAILTKQEHIPDCGAGPSLSNSDVKLVPGLPPTSNDSQLMQGEGQEECHKLEHGFFQTIKLQTAPYKSWCGPESEPLLVKTQRPKSLALIAPLDTEGGDANRLHSSGGSPKFTSPVSSWHFSSLMSESFA